MPRKLAAGLALGLLAAGVTLFLSWAGALDKAELVTYDWRIRRAANPAAIDKQIALVEINETSIRDLSPFVGRWPWPRVVFSWMIDFLNRAPARVIAIDFTFGEPDRTLGMQIGDRTWTAEASDAALADALRRSRSTVLLADARYLGTEGDQANKPAPWDSRTRPFRLGRAIDEPGIILPPAPAFLDATTMLGHNYLPLDPDGTARRILPFIRQGDRYMPSLGLGAAILAGGFKAEDVILDGEAIRFRDRTMPLVPLRVPGGDAGVADRRQLTTLINYKAPALVAGDRPYPSYEARHILVSEEQLRSGEAPQIDPAVFKDKIVFIGLATSGLVDVFSTPFGENSGNMPGIQLHATVADNLLSGRFIRPASDAARIWSVLAAGLLIGFMSALLPFTASAAGALLALSGWTWYALIAFRGGLWVNMAQPLVTMGAALFAGTTYQYFVEGSEKRVVKALFGRYVSRDVYKQLIENPGLAELGGRRRDMTVLFSDIRGFTTVTEKGEPEALVAQLNEYFSKMVEVVFRHHGTVDKFVGDMVMALFGAPVDDPDHAEHAVAAAVDMVKELRELNRKWAAAGEVELDIGIGVNSGDMIAGNIGSSSIMSYTVIGDNVNLGSRLESLNKQYGSRIIISDATRSRLSTAYTLRPLGDVVVKGKTRPVAIMEVVVPSPIGNEPEDKPS